MPARRLRPPRPVALHLAPLLGGRRDRPRLRTGWLGPLPRPRRHAGQPAAGPVARLAAGAGAGDREACRSRRSTARTTTTSGRAASGATVEKRMLEAIGELGAAHAHGDPALAQAAAAARAGGDAAHAAAPFARRTTIRLREPGRVPEVDERFPSRLAALAAMLAAGLPLRCVAITAPGDVRHARRPAEDARGRPEADGRRAARVPARPRGARPRRPRPRPRLVGVRPPRARRTARAAPTTAPPASGS